MMERLVVVSSLALNSTGDLALTQTIRRIYG